MQGNGIELAAKDWRIWAVSRVFTGMGNGLVQTQCVIYIAEIAPIAIRGTLLASYAFAYQIGGLTGAIGLQILQTVSPLDVDCGNELTCSVSSCPGLQAYPAIPMDLYRSVYHLVVLPTRDGM